MTNSAAAALAALRALTASMPARTHRQRAARFEIVDSAAQGLRADVLRSVAAELGVTSNSVARHVALDVAQFLGREADELAAA